MKKLKDFVCDSTIVRGNYVKDRVILNRMIEETRKHLLRVGKVPMSPGLHETKLWLKLNNQLQLLEGLAPDDFHKLTRQILSACGHQSQRGFFGKLFRVKYDSARMKLYLFSQMNMQPSEKMLESFEYMSYHEVLKELIAMYQQKMIRKFKGFK
ncbi:hypothetical protein NCTGTJJY_CDS0223 [Serratia phage 92A1]|nr:hypothetical protein NCTGTJJY_CDS0223 [Serratia phage 92A1]